MGENHLLCLPLLQGTGGGGGGGYLRINYDGLVSYDIELVLLYIGIPSLKHTSVSKLRVSIMWPRLI